MLLQELLQDIECKEIIGSRNKDIQRLSQDSRDETFKDGLYFAVTGTQVDGHDFIPDVISKEAIAIVCEQLPPVLHDDVTYMIVENSRKAVGEIASAFYGHPSRELDVIAVTGTNGKTSVATYASQALGRLGETTLLLSTAGDYFKDELITLERKAPSSLEVIEFHKILRKYRDQGAGYVCLEATSQALDQDRLAGIDIDIAIFTNLDQDHLDYHKTIEHYAASKKKLFDNLKPSAIAISNYDDTSGMMMVKDTQAQKISYGKDPSYDYHFSINSTKLGSVTVTINGQALTLPVIGEFNIYNLISVYAILIQRGFNVHKVVEVLEQVDGVPGRMEQVQNDRGVLALVDYAHSPGALESVLTTLQKLPHNKITTIIGCGGDRDRAKRPLMAEVTQKLSDTVFYTSDNPRTEKLEQIFADMKEGVDTNKNNFTFIENREAAIQQAVNQAGEDDIILVAGKGHEDYQIIGTIKHHFDDKKVIEACFAKINKKSSH